MKSAQPSKPKICAVCRVRFVPARPLQKVCSPICAIEIAKQNARKPPPEAAGARLTKKAIKTKAQWAKEAQSAFNAFIRARDLKEPCISCGQSPTQGQRHASHYRSVGAAPQHRFNTYNAHASCAQCNSMKSGNVVEYRIRLADKIGNERLEFIEHGNERKTYSIEYLKRLKKLFGRRARNYQKWRQA
jgi:hypothetical protein